MDQPIIHIRRWLVTIIQHMVHQLTHPFIQIIRCHIHLILHSINFSVVNNFLEYLYIFFVVAFLLACTVQSVIHE
jgi:hypothetical protein